MRNWGRWAGIRPRRQILVAMLLSGALAGMVGINEIAGVPMMLCGIEYWQGTAKIFSTSVSMVTSVRPRL